MPEQFISQRVEPYEREEALEAISPQEPAAGVVEAGDYEGVPIETNAGEVRVLVQISEAQRQSAKAAMEAAYDERDRIDDAYIDIESTSNQPALFVSVNKGNVGSGAITDIVAL